MKKLFMAILVTASTQLLAQDIPSASLSPEMTSMGSNLGFGIIGILFAVFFYIIIPVIFYCISSYSLSLLSKHYTKRATSGISWVPFARYYDFIKQATGSSRKAFFVTLFPWIMAAIGILAGIVAALSTGFTPTEELSGALITFSLMIFVGVISIIVMNFWRAFIISKFVKGDVTTAFGLSTYTTIVLWYIALDRVRNNTNIIGILGFVSIGLVVCFYIGIIAILGLSGLESFL